MGFFENWISDKVSAAFGRGTGMLQPVPAGGPPLQARDKAPQSAPVPSSDAKLRKAAAELMGGHDFTAKPTIDPSVLQTIMPRDGNASLTVSGLDGVLTVGKDMVMRSAARPSVCSARWKPLCTRGRSSLPKAAR